MNIQKIDCDICAKECRISDGRRGACGKYTVNAGGLQEITPNRYLVACGISIETIPVLHFHPKGKFLQITTTGCNFSCPGCISTVLVKEIGRTSPALHHLSPAEVIEKAKAELCIGIAFLMNDPLASFFTFVEVASLAKQAGLLVGCSTNGYFTSTSAQKLAPLLDFVNLGIKGFSDLDYQKCGASSLQPVLNTIRLFHDNKVHVEVSVTCKRGDEASVESFASWLDNAGLNIPLQLMRYLPLEDASPDLEPTIRDAEALVARLKRQLDWVYLFNSPGTPAISTYCPKCDTMLIERDFFGPMGAKTRKIVLAEGNLCPQCHLPIPIKGLTSCPEFMEKDFEGGYPFTRALEMIQAILVACGVHRLETVAGVWENLLGNGGLNRFHKALQSLDSYLAAIEEFAAMAGPEAIAVAAELTAYMRQRIESIGSGLRADTPRPRAYYCMGKPLFCLKGERFENQLVTAAGGLSVNTLVEGDGRPGLTLTVSQLNDLNPEVIFISSFLSNTVDHFYRDCLASGITVDAVQAKRIFTHSSPNWDFGSPRWILGLMNIANILHPELFSFNMRAEAEQFYQRFYGIDFDPSHINLSFAKPATTWQWQPA